jgi:hypothetical protein
MNKKIAVLRERLRIALMKGVGQPAIPESYVTEKPSAQSALDLFAGDWESDLPPPVDGCRAGKLPLSHDPRLIWGLQELGGAVGRSVLELGPLEGAHTHMLERCGATHITAIEANPRAFLKCLVYKEVTQIKRARFLCGDFMQYLRYTDLEHDICVGSGVLYHMKSPVELLELIARRCRRVFLWTHYFDRDRVAAQGRLDTHFGEPQATEHAGFEHHIHLHKYLTHRYNQNFRGGPDAYSYWLSREDIIGALKFFGMDDVRVGFEEPGHRDGPSFCIAAQRSSDTR